MTDDAPQIRITIDEESAVLRRLAFRRLVRRVATAGPGHAEADGTFAADLKDIRTARELARKAVE